ncbi:MAG: 4Fe-4S dicluster domain-containing protein [Dehalococcoidia bacterium]|nr:4Fe-4S dicluster domain-containing protein [Dehalococcoidia bacterium]
MLPTITVDDKKCQDPLACSKCLRICPTHVLGLGTKVGPRKFQEIDPGQFIVAGVRFEKCTGCMDCVNICPKNAIQVSF